MLKLAPILRLKICSKRPLQISAPSLPREKMSFGTRYDIRDVYGLYGSFNKNMKLLNIININLLSKSHRFASHFLDRNIHDSTKLLYFIKFLIKLCPQPPAFLRLKLDKRNKYPPSNKRPPHAFLSTPGANSSIYVISLCYL